MMPPMPRVSAMVWRRPNCLRDLEVGDRRGLVAADLEGDDDEVGAVEGLALVGVGLDLAGTPRVEAIFFATTSLSARRLGSMSIRRISAPASAGRCSTSPMMFFMKTVEPAPMKAMTGLAGMGTPFRRRPRRRRARGAGYTRSWASVRTSATGPSSTILPFCITMTRWQRARTTFRSCEMKR